MALTDLVGTEAFKIGLLALATLVFHFFFIRHRLAQGPPPFFYYYEDQQDRRRGEAGDGEFNDAYYTHNDGPN